MLQGRSVSSPVTRRLLLRWALGPLPKQPAKHPRKRIGRVWR
jgi:hypothetical protein